MSNYFEALDTVFVKRSNGTEVLACVREVHWQYALPMATVTFREGETVKCETTELSKLRLVARESFTS